MTKLKIILAGSIVTAAVFTSFLIQRRAQAISLENEAVLRQQDRQIAVLAADNLRLSDLMVQLKTNSSSPDDRRAELAQLRARVQALQKQVTQPTEYRREKGSRFFSQGDFNILKHNKETSISFGDSPRETGRLNDARVFTEALLQYARANQGEYPLSLDQVAHYLPKALEADSPSSAKPPLTGTNDFEIVFQGKEDDLAGIPPRRVALIRERHPWQTSGGNWARTYGFADGAANTIESDDNFQSWDAQHIIPPKKADQ